MIFLDRSGSHQRDAETRVARNQSFLRAIAKDDDLLLRVVKECIQLHADVSHVHGDSLESAYYGTLRTLFEEYIKRSASQKAPPKEKTNARKSRKRSQLR